MEEHAHHSSKAGKFFGRQKRELSRADVERSAHYTYRDGFRLGFGIFVGFMAGTLMLVLVIYLLNLIFRAL